MKPLLIAEIGWSHQGNMVLAKEMVSAAAENGADYVKFQTWKVSRLKAGDWDHDGRRQIYESAELTPEQHVAMSEYCNSQGVRFLTSCFSVHDLDLVRSVCDDIKIAGVEVGNIRMLEKIAKMDFNNVFLSTGASTLGELEKAYDILKHKRPFVMHCVSSYPCTLENCNLGRIGFLKHILNAKVGYSGHFVGIMDAVLALKYDLEAIEKHFTIDRNLPGRDNKFAILPHELKELAEYIDAKDKACRYISPDFLECERDARDNHRGRWDN